MMSDLIMSCQTVSGLNLAVWVEFWQLVEKTRLLDFMKIV